MADPQEDHLEWQRQRAAAVAGPSGNLALIAFHPVTAEPTLCEELGVEVRRDGDEEGVRVRATGTAPVAIDGETVVGERFFGRLGADGSPLLTTGNLTADAFSLDGSDYELRVYDAAATNRSAFDRIDTWPYDPGAVARGRLRRHTGIELVPWEFTRESDSGHTKRVPGILCVTMAGETRDLVAFLDSGNLVLVFADATSGAESYAPGRFLRMDPPEEGDLVQVDFNRAFIPPCGFSDFYSCPIPPPENRFTVPIRAGERAVVWSDGRDH